MFVCCHTALRPHPDTHLDGCAFAMPMIGAHRAPGPAVTPMSTIIGWDDYVMPRHRGPRLAVAGGHR